MKSRKNITNAIEEYGTFIEVAHDFLELTARYGIDGIDGKRAPSDMRFKTYVNGSYMELNGFCFVYDYMGNAEVGLTRYVHCAEMDRTVVLKATGERAVYGDLLFEYVSDMRR